MKWQKDGYNSDGCWFGLWDNGEKLASMSFRKDGPGNVWKVSLVNTNGHMKLDGTREYLYSHYVGEIETRMPKKFDDPKLQYIYNKLEQYLLRSDVAGYLIKLTFEYNFK